MSRANEARLDLGALRHNLGIARELAPGSRLMAVVKANAYGHGAATIAPNLEPLVDALAVACIEEARELRAAGVKAPILLLEGPFEASEVGEASESNFWLMIDNEQHVAWVEEASVASPINCWLKIDSGMHRLGCAPADAQGFRQRLEDSANTTGQPVLVTHFASADNLESEQTREQLALFKATCQDLPGLQSAANSPGLLGWPESHLDWIRPGYMLYGNSPFAGDHAQADRLRPVMTLTSAVISVRDVPAGDSVGYAARWFAERDSRIATICIGYGDGYPRSAKNGTPVLINGKRAPMVGRVSMDMITVDVTDLPGVAIGDEVVLWGEGLPAKEVAMHADTIGYELTSRMPARTPRVVIG